MSSAFNQPQPGHSPPLVYTDETHQRASIIIATAVLLFTALLFVGSRLWVRHHPDQEKTGSAGEVATAAGSFLGIDDWLLVTATVLYIIHAALVFSACLRGLGNTIESMSTGEVQAVEKLFYASSILYVLAIGVSNSSVAWLMVRINSSRTPTVTRSLKGIMAFVVLWTIAMVFVMAFACPSGHFSTLSTEQCPDLFGKWMALGVGGSCFEVVVAGMAVWQVSHLNTSLVTKAFVVSLFGLRLPIILLVAIQLSSFQAQSLDLDGTLNIKLFVCLSELVLSYNICSANFPAFRRLTRDIRTDFGGFTLGARSELLSLRKDEGSSIDYVDSGVAKRGPEMAAVPINVSAEGLHATEVQGQRNEYTVGASNGDGRSVSSLSASEHKSTDVIVRTRTDVVVRSESGSFSEP